MATTTNYSWTTPDDTALVKDGAAAIRTLGSSIDTTTKNLNPSTTLGDIEYRSSTANTNTRLGIGSTGNVLTVSGGVPVWSAPAGAGASWTLLNTGGTALTGAATITVSGISGQNQLFIVYEDASSANAESMFTLRFNADSTTKYNVFGSQRSFNATYSRDQAEQSTKGQDTGQTEIVLGRMSATATSSVSGYCQVSGTNTTNPKMFNQVSGVDISSTNSSFSRNTGGYYTGTSTISSVSILSDSGNFDAGTIFIYGSAV
jgi:hypothetical protein